MYIKSMVLDGFKSYGQRTEIPDFDHEFNAITGLNGSGKSNILDAICFVLGISNLTHVRAASFQDLIYKSGQGGVNKATVSIIFDNRNPAQCPPGFENFDEITITRQVIMGGKNKYLINGSNVLNKKVQDLFCSVQLNVNNPHFLIMQGKITKVLNMKPPEILAMVEEAAGTRMYEVKRQAALKTIEKKDAKLTELQTIVKEEINPKLKKLKEERQQYLEYQRMERELDYLMGLFESWQFHESKKHTKRAEEALDKGQSNIKEIEDQIGENNEIIGGLEEEIEEITRKNQSESADKLKTIETELKEKEKVGAKSSAAINAIKDNIAAEEKKKSGLEKNLKDDSKALKLKEEELEKVQSVFETLKTNDSKDSDALSIAQKKYEALSAGMEVNDEGEAQTLQEQLMRAKEEAAVANTESKQSTMELKHCQTQLAEKKKDFGSNSAEYQRDRDNLNRMEAEVNDLERRMTKIRFSEDRMHQLQNTRRDLIKEIRSLKEHVENFSARRPYTQFRYRDPETNFNRQSVKGVVCKLFKVVDDTFCTALETAAGGRLYNVVVDTEVTSKKLLQRGNLQQRTTFVPLNKVQAHRMNDNIIKLAQDLVGEENVYPAISLLNYHKSLQPAMEFIFGNVFICKDINIAKQVTFHQRIKKKCVTLEGDVTDPAGTLSGGARQKGGSILVQLQEIAEYEKQLEQKEAELAQIEGEIREMGGAQEQYESAKRQLDMKQHELGLVRQRLEQSTHHRQQEEIEHLTGRIEELKLKEVACKDVETKCNTKAKELQDKMKDSKGYKEKQLKEAEAEMKRLKAKADKSRKEWKQREQEYETLNLEIAELTKGLAATEQQLATTIENISTEKVKFEELSVEHDEIKALVAELQDKFKKEKAIVAEKNKEVQKKVHKKEKLAARNTDLELEIKKMSHEIKKLEDDFKGCQSREHELSKKMKKGNQYLEEGAKMDDKQGKELDRRIRSMREIKDKLGRNVNTKAQSMFEHEEKQYNELIKKQNIVENDKKKLVAVIKELDEKKKTALKLAFEQVSKDFGSIFSSLLPGANAKLVAPFGQSILEGLEVKVSLGGVWKESLTELSGGQRSLAALSLILAMLLFKPAPLYILDEVDAALDLSHTQNIGTMFKEHFKKSQFIIVSLKDGMFSNANVLYRTKFIDNVSTITRTSNRH